MICKVPDIATRDSGSNNASHVVRFLSPDAFQQQTHFAQVEVSTNGLQFSTSYPKHLFAFVEYSHAISLHPQQGPTRGGTQVSLHFAAEMRYTLSSNIQCKFGNSLVQGQIINALVLRCLSPQSSARFSVVEVTGNGYDYTSSGLTFEHVLFEPFKLSPAAGPEAGGTEVELVGSRIGEMFSELFCEFVPIKGNRQVQNVSAVSRSSDKVTCLTPRVIGRQTHELYIVSHSGRIGPPVLFAYTNEQVNRLQPSQGPVNGGTVVRLQGDGFFQLSAWECYFASHVVPAQIISDNELRCTSPHFGACGGVVNVLLCASGASCIGEGLSFAYIPKIRIANVLPVRGPAHGGTLITISFTNCQNWTRVSSLPILACKFEANGEWTAASFLSVSTVRCRTPSRAPGYVGVHLATDRMLGTDASTNIDTGDSVTFEYFEASIHAVTPLSGPTLGHSHVTIMGTNFYAPLHATVRCQFGHFTTPGEILSSTTIICKTDRHDASGSVALQVLVNDVPYPDFDSRLSFFFFPEPDVNGIRPAFGPSDGGTVISVTARASFPSGSPICQFSNMLYSIRYMGTFVSLSQRQHANIISCVTPSLLPGVWTIRLLVSCLLNKHPVTHGV